MRVGRSVKRIFRYMVFPAVSAAVVSYFGYNAVYGERGYIALQNARMKLADAQDQFDQISGQNDRLEHRIQLLKSDNPDPDLVEELARTQLMDGAPGQLAVPRNKP